MDKKHLPRLLKKDVATQNDAKKGLLKPDSHFAIVEAYKKMRTNFLFMLHDERKVVAFSSTVANEGKTTNCLNLAISFADVDKKIVIIDADMRRPQIHNHLSVPLSPGLSDYLGEFTNDIPIVKTEYENLDVISAGTLPPSPSELLMSPRFENLLDQLRDKYDFIFIDTPPVHIVSDLAVFAAKIDGVVFVVREKKAPIETIKKTVENVHSVGGKVLGLVFNGSEKVELFAKYSYRKRYESDGYGYGYGYYGYSSSAARAKMQELSAEAEAKKEKKETK